MVNPFGIIMGYELGNRKNIWPKNTGVLHLVSGHYNYRSTSIIPI